MEVAYDHVRHSLHHTAARRKRIYDVKAVNRKFPLQSWVLLYYPPAAQNKLGSPWVGPHQVVRQATGHTVGIQKGPDTRIVFIHVDYLKLCPAPGMLVGPLDHRQRNHCVQVRWLFDLDLMSVTPNLPHPRLCLPTTTCSNIRSKLDDPIDLTDHILSPFFVRDFHFQGCRFHSIAHLVCFRYAVIHGLRLFATSIRKWTRHLLNS